MQCVHWWDFSWNVALEGCALLEETLVMKEEVKLCCRWEAAIWVEICGLGGVYELEVRRGRRFEAEVWYGSLVHSSWMCGANGWYIPLWVTEMRQNTDVLMRTSPLLTVCE